MLAKRNLLRFRRSPELVAGFIFQPIMFILLFVYVLGGAIQTPGFDYVDFLMPGIIVQTIAFGGFVTAIALAEDLNKGLIDRFRSAVLAGRTLADVVTNVITLVVMITVGVLVGFNFQDSGALEIIAGFGLLILIGYTFSWVYALMGLVASNAEAAQQLGFILIFPLTFASSAFVPIESMPSWLESFATVNPFTVFVDGMRALWLGTPAGNAIWGSLAWCVGLIAIFAPFATWRYKRTVSS
jgi:ABC-2 type transport system permease protein/oleandomycin transport system permease protein